ncbi:angiotensin-converting enzyme-like [Ctenocephalides felis]|uniref:angiotensin-converting enzyme-like n=1 Tax=Ctenocephalides felis TaxID=7515 RepID=UPI000E6E3DB7|nr:angiotensin-converting enzyme-like [Ctenocephalides felis]
MQLLLRNANQCFDIRQSKKSEENTFEYNIEIDDDKGDSSIQQISRNIGDGVVSLHQISRNNDIISCFSNTAKKRKPDSLESFCGPLEKQNNHANERILEVLIDVSRELSKEYNRNALAQWAYETNVSSTTKLLSMRALLRASKAEKRLIAKLNRTLCEFDLKDACPDVQRQVAFLLKEGPSALSEEKFEKLDNILKTFENIYGTATVCNYKDDTRCGLKLEPELTERMANSRNPDELLYFWTAWRNATGRKMRKYYSEYVELMNEASYLNSQFIYQSFDRLTEIDPLLPDEINQIAKILWEQVEPLYKQLHAYVRYKLRNIYGETLIPVRGCIPAHLLGNMWAQTWTNLFNETMPYPENKLPDITAAMRKKGYTPKKMFRIAEHFFLSLNMSAMPTSFWRNSVITRPSEDVNISCHPSAWDMFDGKDFRIKMCTEVTYENFVTIYHEMGHVQYYLEYKNLPLPYRKGANPGFHEAIGDTIALSVMTMCYLKKIGLAEKAKHFKNAQHDKNHKIFGDSARKIIEKDLNFEEKTDDNDDEDEDFRKSSVKDLGPCDKKDMNFLMRMALEKVAFLPFGYIVDLWRSDVSGGMISERDYNEHWWKLRGKYQGICPPLQRSEEDFDPGAKYHIAAGVPYLRYFISTIIQFQFYSALCQRAGQYVETEYEDDETDGSPFLHRCSIYGCPAVGEQLKEALSLGSSRPWPEVMKILANDDTMDATALLKYFEPLHKYLEQENERNKEEIGWDQSVPCSTKL